GSASEPNAFKFFPAEISVPVGSAVVWENKSSIPHDAVADNGTFKSPRMNQGQKFEFKFTAPGDYKYVCTESGHEGAGMTAVVRVTGGGSTPTTAAPTTTTQAPTSGASVTTTTAKPGETTTTTVKNGAAAGSTTTTVAGATEAGVTTSSAPAATPTPAPEGCATTTTTGHGEEAAAGDHDSGGTSSDEKSSPLGIAFAGISTLILVGISTKLLASRS
ncbi:MAG: plastocyanin/azurin family copper-binding protein, partial [Acidimicrobiia bacterium]